MTARTTHSAVEEWRLSSREKEEKIDTAIEHESKMIEITTSVIVQ
jgi:hypothetical protein